MQTQKPAAATEKMVKSERAPPETPSEPVYASFEGPDDPEHPYNWSPLTKIAHITIVSAKIFVVSFALSIFGAATGVVAEVFNASEVVIQLGVALYVAGFAIGPLVAGPSSEVVGNLPPMVFGCVACSILQIPPALAKDVPTVLVSRFLAGALGGAVLGVGTDSVAELYEPIPRAAALAFSVSSINLGSTAGPAVGSYVVERFGWGWTAWVTLIMFVSLEPVVVFTLKESVPKRILVSKAKRLRKQTRRAIAGRGRKDQCPCLGEQVSEQAAEALLPRTHLGNLDGSSDLCVRTALPSLPDVAISVPKTGLAGADFDIAVHCRHFRSTRRPDCHSRVYADMV